MKYLIYNILQGDTALACAVKMQHPREVVNYLCAGIQVSPGDVASVFDASGRNFFYKFRELYPVFNKYV